jgi:MFS family permease
MASNPSFTEIDEVPLKRFHWRAVVTTGMGVFTDGYDLSSIGIVLPMVLATFGVQHLTGFESGMLAGSALIGAAVGALIFGVLAQRGRKLFYGYDVALMAIAAVAQIFAPTLWSLIAIRFVLGIGVGADYVLSPTIMAEHSNRAERGRKIGIGFGFMWAFGAAVAGLLALIMQSAGVSADLTWRIVLAFGAVPALSVLYMRRTMPETARFLARMADEPEAAAGVVHQIAGKAPGQLPGRDERPFGQVFAEHARQIFTAALLWMVFDIVIYSGILFGPSLIAKGLGMQPIEFSLAMSLIFTIPSGLIYSFFVIDKAGRKPLQTWGFVGAAVMLALFAAVQHQVAAIPLLGFILYGLYSICINAPSTVAGAGILGVELSPTRIRTVGQSITVVGGRIGASISAFLFPLLFGAIGETGVIALLAGVSVLGAILTYTLLPETAGRSLEDINRDAGGQRELALAGAARSFAG